MTPDLLADLLVEVEKDFKDIEVQLLSSGKEAFEKFWEKALTRPEFVQVAFMKKILEAIYLHAYVEGGTESVLRICEAFARLAEPVSHGSVQ